MTDHASAVRGLVASEPMQPVDRPNPGGRLQRLCRTAARDLDATGVGVSVLSQAGELVSVAASSDLSERVEQLQFSLGEGPCLEAYASRSPLLIADLESDAGARWPAYVPAAHEYGVCAVFAFPLQVGVARLGALDVYRDEVGSLSHWALLRSLAYAEAALETLLDGDHGPDEASTLLRGGDNQFEVYQAQGMVMVQLGVPADQAMARIRAYAYRQDRRIGEVAADIVARRVRLERDGPGP